MKYMIIILLGLSLAHSYTQLTLVDCQIKIGGYQGLYRSFSGEYYTLNFRTYCPYTYTIKWLLGKTSNSLAKGSQVNSWGLFLCFMEKYYVN